MKEEFLKQKIHSADLFLIPLKNRKSIFITLHFNVGGFLENSQNAGISHLLEHTLFLGSKHYPDEQAIGQAIEKYGGIMNAFTSHRTTGFWIHIPASSWEKTIPVIFDIVFQPKAIYNQNQIAKEKRVIIEEIKRNRDNPDTFLADSVLKNLNPNHPVSRPLIGYIKTIKKIDSEEIVNWWKRFYLPSNLKIAISGYIPKNLEQKISYLIPKDKEKNKIVFPKYKSPKKPRIKINIRKMDQIKLNIAFDDDQKINLRKKLIFHLAEKIIGRGMDSILFREIRTKARLCYDISANADFFKEFSIFSIEGGFSQDRIKKTIEKIIKILAKIKEQGLPKDKFQEAKTFVQGQLEMQSDDQAALSLRLLTSLELFNRPIGFKRLVKELKSIEKKEVDSFLNKLIQPNNSAITTLGVFKEKHFLLKSLNKLKK